MRTHLNAIVIQFQFTQAPQFGKDSVANKVQIISGELQ